jgi:hypothetical protein
MKSSWVMSEEEREERATTAPVIPTPVSTVASSIINESAAATPAPTKFNAFDAERIGSLLEWYRATGKRGAMPDNVLCEIERINGGHKVGGRALFEMYTVLYGRAAEFANGIEEFRFVSTNI